MRFYQLMMKYLLKKTAYDASFTSIRKSVLLGDDLRIIRNMINLAKSDGVLSNTEYKRACLYQDKLKAFSKADERHELIKNIKETLK